MYVKQAKCSLDGRYIINQMTGGVEKSYVTYVHAITRGTVTATGNIFSHDYKIVSRSSLYYSIESDKPPVYNDSRFYNEVFTMGQAIDGGYYQTMMEDLPRLAPFLRFLRQHSTIHIHTTRRDARTDALFLALDLDPNRIVTGDVHGQWTVTVGLINSMPSLRPKYVAGLI